MTKPEPLSFTVHNVAPPDVADTAQAAQRRTRGGRLKMLLVLLACAAPVLVSYFMYYVVRPDGRTNYSSLIQPTRSLPAMTMTRLDGSVVTPARLRGQWLVVAVGPAACDTACEQRLFTQRQLREMLGRERDRVDKIWLLTDDRALAPSLREAMAAQPAMQVLRAPREQVAAWLQPEAGRALEEHLYVVDPMGEWMMRLPVNAEPARAKSDLSRLLRASSFWDQPGR